MSSPSVDPTLLTGMGAAISILLTAAGAAIASGHAGIFALRNAADVKGFVPIVQAGVLAVYGIIIGVMLSHKMVAEPTLTVVQGYRYLSAGLSVGCACLASGCGMASFIRQCNEGKAVSSVAAATAAPVGKGESQPLLPASPAEQGIDFKKLIMVMIFLEAIGLYGLVVSLFLIGY